MYSIVASLICSFSYKSYANSSSSGNIGASALFCVFLPNWFYYLKLQMAHQNAYLLYVQISYCLLYTEQLYSIFIILSIEKSIRFECFSFMNFYLMYLSLRFQTVRQTLLLIPFVYHTKSRQNLVGLEHLVYYLFYF